MNLILLKASWVPTYEVLYLDFVTENLVDIGGSDKYFGDVKLRNTSKT